jgi:phosphomannomutase
LPENLKQLCERVVSEKADIGFAVDPDVDRLAIVSEKGKPLGEEYTLVLAIKYMLKKMDGPIVVNASVTQAVDDLAKKYNTEVIRTKVVEIHVAKKMKQVRAVIGGEGNGGVILPELHLGRDAPLGIALKLQ